MGFTEEEYEQLKANVAKGAKKKLTPEEAGRRRRTWRAGIRTVAGKKYYFRSRWEYNYALVLEFRKSREMIIDWEYEIETFWFHKIKRGTRSYLPDFKVYYWDGHIEYHEVKGWVDQRSRTIFRRMRIYYPEIKLITVGADFFKKNEFYSRILKGWES